MKHSSNIYLEHQQPIKDIVLKLDDFLQEYWKSESHKIVTKEGEIKDSSSYFDLSMQLANENLAFYTFVNDADYQFLVKNQDLTPSKTDIFHFIIEIEKVKISFYNSIVDDSRLRQFEKIVNSIKTNIENDLPLPRIKKLSENTNALLYKHRSYVNKVGFGCYVTNESHQHISDNSLFIYYNDFEYIRPFIYKVFPKEEFDDTSWNNIEKQDWLKVQFSLKNYKTNDFRLEAFYKYLIDWIEKELKLNDATYICFWGNL